MSWKSIEVRHPATGRTGKIRTDAEGFMHRGLHIVDTQGQTAYVQLNADGPDTGDKGWEWKSNLVEAGQNVWLALGDHN